MYLRRRCKQTTKECVPLLACSATARGCRISATRRFWSARHSRLLLAPMVPRHVEPLEDTPKQETRTHISPGSYVHSGLRRTICKQIALYRLAVTSDLLSEWSFLVAGWLACGSVKDGAQKPRAATPRLATRRAGRAWSCQHRRKEGPPPRQEKTRSEKTKKS